MDVLVKLMRNTGMLRFKITPPGQRTPQDILYTNRQLQRLKTLGCAAVGLTADRRCVERKAATSLDAELLRLASLSYAARTGGDGDNFILRRGALLTATCRARAVRLRGLRQRRAAAGRPRELR